MGGACDGLSFGCSAEKPTRDAFKQSADVLAPSEWDQPGPDTMQATLPRLEMDRGPPAGGVEAGGGETRMWLPAAAIGGTKPRMPKEDCDLPESEEDVAPVCEHTRLLKWGLLLWKKQLISAGCIRRNLKVCVPPRLQAIASSASRETSVAARVHAGATVAVIIPKYSKTPTEEELTRHHLRHAEMVRGWATLTDGSALGLLQATQEEARLSRRRAPRFCLDTTGSGWADHGQAKAFHRAQIQIVKLLGTRVASVEKLMELRNAPRSDCHEVLSRALPGARMWPLHDQLVNRVFLLNISRERCRSLRDLLRLDRGPRFLDVARLHYGEEVAFLFAWHSHYLHALAAFVVVTVPFIVLRTVQGKGHIDHSMLPHSLLTILFGVGLTEFWRPQAKRLVHRWHAHGDCAARWHRMVLDLLESDEKRQAGLGRRGQTSPRELTFRTLESERTNEGEFVNEGLSDELVVMTPRSQPSEAAERNLRGSPNCEDQQPDQQPGRVQRHFSLRGLSQLEAAAVDACMDTFGIKTPPSRRRLVPSWSSPFPEDVIRILKSTLLIPVLLLEWVTILIFFSSIVWFEIWVIFDWGGCRKFNEEGGFRPDEWRCLSADYLRGPFGIVMGALPSIAEGAFFELLLIVSKVTAQTVIKLYHFRTREQHDFAVVTVIFLLEVIGKVGFILVLGLGFVPVWSSHDWTHCRKNWDYFIMGEWSLGCLKGQIPFQVRLKLFESIMKGPMWVSGMVGILVKVLIPIILSNWRRCLLGPTTYEDGCGCRCRRHRIVRWLLAPSDFVLRVCMLILQADCGAVGGLRLICRWPPWLAKEQPSIQGIQEGARRFSGYSRRGPEVSDLDISEMQAATKRARFCGALLEGERREHEPFDEYIELLLHFLWTSCFTIVWPLGCVFAVINQFLELRFDCAKLLIARRRRFPSTRHMSVAWVPRYAQIICHVSMVVNVMLLLMPYRQLLIWSPDSCSTTQDGTVSFLTACRTWQIVAAFLITWLCFVVIHIIATIALGRLARLAQRRGWLRAKTPTPESSSRQPFSSTARRLRHRRMPDTSPESVDSLGMRAA